MAIEDISTHTANLGYTGQFRYNKGDILIANKNNPEVLTKLGIGNPGDVLTVNPATGLPSWGKDAVLNIMSGISIPVALTHNHIFIGDASNLSADVAMSGDATIVASGALTIANDAVTFAKMQNVSTGVVLGRTTAGSGDIEQLTTLPTGVQDNITRLGTIVSIGTPLGSTFGGTGLNSYITGDILYASATDVLSKLPISSNDHFLTISSGIPAWSTDTFETSVITVIDQQIADGKLSSWYLITIPYSDFSDATPEKTIDLITLASGEVLELAKITGVGFTGSGLTTLSSKIGIIGSLAKYCKPTNVLSDKKVCTINAEIADTLKVTLTANINLNGLTAGTLKIWIKTAKEI